MDNKSVKVKCYKCSGMFTTDEMRYDPDKPQNLVCKGCLTRKSDSKVTATESEESGNVKYYCVKCNYKFMRRKDVSVSACPYCGKSGTLTAKTDVNDLLKSADSEAFQR